LDLAEDPLSLVQEVITIGQVIKGIGSDILIAYFVKLHFASDLAVAFRQQH